jgi:hypothetical protein
MKIEKISVTAVYFVAATRLNLGFADLVSFFYHKIIILNFETPKPIRPDFY